MKKYIMTTITILLFLLVCVKYSNFYDNDKEIPIKYIEGSYAVDRSDKKCIIGDVDYVFLAYVNKETGTEYAYPIEKETEEGTITLWTPFTKYSINVIQNIKGNLITDDSIEIKNYGGLDKSGSYYILPENTSLLESGQYYILTAYAQPDGSLLISGENSSTKIDPESAQIVDNFSDNKEIIKNEILKDKKINEYVDAYKHEKQFERTRYVSNYDVSKHNN